AHEAQELRMVVVEREQPAQTLEAYRRLASQSDRAVRRLPGSYELGAALDIERRRQQAVAERTRRIAREPRGERERVRSSRSDCELDRQRSARAASGAARIPSSAARSSTSRA